MQLDELPHNLEAERAVIGSCLLDGAIAGEISDLTTDDFYLAENRHYFSAMIQMIEEGQAVEVLSLVEVLKINKVPEIYRSVPVLMAMATGLPINADLSRYRDMLKRKSAERKFIKAQYRNIQSLIRGESDLNAVLETSEAVAKNLKSDFAKETTGFVSIGTLVDTVLKPELENYRDNKTSKIPLGVPFIDKNLRGGVAKKQLIILSALTGGGKSALAWFLCSQMARQNTPAAFASLEMSDLEILERALINQANTNRISGYCMDDLQSGMSATDFDSLTQYAEMMKPMPIHLSTKSVSIGKLKRETDWLIENEMIKVLFVDYLQLVKTEETRRGSSRADVVEEVSRGLKDIARDCDIPVVALSQMNREGSKSPGTNQIFNLKGSSEIEQAADIIFNFEFEPKENEDWFKGVITIGKGRNIARRPIDVEFNPKAMMFREYEGWVS